MLDFDSKKIAFHLNGKANLVVDKIEYSQFLCAALSATSGFKCEIITEKSKMKHLPPDFKPLENVSDIFTQSTTKVVLKQFVFLI